MREVGELDGVRESASGSVSTAFSVANRSPRRGFRYANILVRTMRILYAVKYA